MGPFKEKTTERRKHTSAADKKYVTRPFGDRIVVTENRRDGYTIIDDDGTKIHFESD